MKPLKDATEDDIHALKERLKERREQRLVDLDAERAIEIVHKRKENKHEKRKHHDRGRTH